MILRNAIKNVQIKIKMFSFFFQYGISLIIILVIEITAAGIVLGYKDKVETEVKKALKYTIKEQYKTPEKADLTTVGWNHFMIQVLISRS